MKIIDQLGLKAKVLGLVGLCLMLLTFVAGFSLWPMAKISREVDTIDQLDVPLTQARIGHARRCVCDRLDGSISVDSQRGEGSVFTVRFPIRGPAEPTACAA